MPAESRAEKQQSLRYHWRAMRALTSIDVTSLVQLRRQFGRDDAAKKNAKLRECSQCRLSSACQVRHYHDALLFMAAYPDNRSVATLVDAELARIEQTAQELHKRESSAAALEGAGLAGELIDCEFSIEIIQWLAERFPHDVSLAWKDGAIGNGLDDVLSLALLPMERDGGFTGGADVKDWVELIANAGSNSRTELAWILAALRQLALDSELLDLLVEKLDLCVRWRLRASGPTGTNIRFPKRPVFWQRRALRRTFDITRLLGRPVPDPARLSGTGARKLIDVARSVLAIRGREADPVTYANPREVTLFTLDRGIDIAIFGMQPNRRLPMDSYFGYVAARNRVPVAYGGGWVFDRRAEIGMHLFDTFRGGESAYLFAQILRTYRQWFNVSYFRVDPYQFGADNPDAIRSGAFWFYYRFGFRPRVDALRSLAEHEYALIQRNHAHRTSRAVLRRFTHSPLVLDLNGDDQAKAMLDPAQLGLAVTTHITSRFGTDRVAAQRWARRHVTRLLETSNRSKWSDDERSAFDQYCPLVAMLEGVNEWSKTDRNALATVMKSKGGTRERDHVLRFQRHTRLLAALQELQSESP